MDRGLVAALQMVGSMNKQEAATVLVSAFTAVGAGRHTVRVVRDRFDAIVGQAQDGTPQLIGARSKGMTVVMSLSDLVDIVQVSGRRQSFGEALDAAGFQPVSDKKVVVREGFPPEPLVRRKDKGADGD